MAVERELIEAGIRWRWINDGTDRVTWNDAIALIATAGPESALVRNSLKKDWEWNLTNQLLAHIADQQAMSAWTGKGQKPKPIPRPGVEGPNPGKWTRGFNQDAIVSVADPAASKAFGER